VIHTKKLYFIALFLSVFVALGTLRFIPLGLPLAFEVMMPHIELRPIAFLTHILAATVALGIGGFQLWDTFRQRYLAWHRWAGRVYVLSVLAGSAGGIVLGLFALGGPIAKTGFVLLAILWWVTTIISVVNIKAGNVQAHRAWMYRSFSLTFAAVTLRLQLLAFAIIGVNYVEASVWLAWTAWVPNLVLAECWIRNSKRSITG